jgi:hypothetical protein
MGGTIPFSGSIDGDTLRLSGGANGGSFTVNAQRSTEAVFNQRVQQLTAQAGQTSLMQAEQAANEKERKDIGNLTGWLQNYSRLASVHLQRLPKVPQTCSAVTSKMEAALEKEESLPAGSYARGQVDYFIGTLNYQFNSLHYDLQSVESSFGYSDGKITNSGAPEAILRAQAYCGFDHHPITLGPDCANFQVANTAYQADVKQLETLFTAAESAWNAEHVKQKAIEKQADALSN